MDIEDYILLGGGLLIGLVALHGLWMAWRRVRAPQAAEAGLAEHQTDLPFEPDLPLVPEVDRVAAGPLAEIRRVEPAIGGDEWYDPEPDDDGYVEGAYAEDDASVATPPKRGRKVIIPGKRTEPTVPRTSRQFDAVQAQRAEAASKSSNGLDDVVVIWVVAKPGASLDGHGLLEALTANQLQYAGDVFRKLDPNTGAERYQVVNGIEPGTFDLSDLDALSTPRIVMLLRFSPHNDPADAFDDMLEVAQDVATTLDAELKDEQMSDMSAQTVEHCRQRTLEYKRTSMRK